MSWPEIKHKLAAFGHVAVGGVRKAGTERCEDIYLDPSETLTPACLQSPQAGLPRLHDAHAPGLARFALSGLQKRVGAVDPKGKRLSDAQERPHSRPTDAYFLFAATITRAGPEHLSP